LGLDYTDPSNPVFYFPDNHGIETFTSLDELVQDKYLPYTQSAERSYGEGDYNVNLNSAWPKTHYPLIISKIKSILTGESG
jgi:hypothetical protein